MKIKKGNYVQINTSEYILIDRVFAFEKDARLNGYVRQIPFSAKYENPEFEILAKDFKIEPSVYAACKKNI